MKTGKVLAMACLVVMPAIDARDRGTAGECVKVYLSGADLVPFSVLQLSETTADRIFADIGVSVYWTRYTSRPVAENCAVIHLQFGASSPERRTRDALAYAFPYQGGGTQIHVFADRILRCPTSRQNGVLLGHVMTHEITHVLEEISRHSEDGVMKAKWTNADFNEMFARPLRFAGEDVELIHLGIAKRRQVLGSLAR